LRWHTPGADGADLVDFERHLALARFKIAGELGQARSWIRLRSAVPVYLEGAAHALSAAGT